MSEISSVDLASYILKTRIYKEHDRFSDSKLYKLIYYIQGYGLAWTKQNIVSDLPIASRTGPYYENLSQALSNQIDLFSIDQNIFPTSNNDIPDVVKIIENSIWESFVMLNGRDLIKKTMNETIYQRSLLNEDKRYREEDLKTYFSAVHVLNSSTDW